jgi:hypothetical protein
MIFVVGGGIYNSLLQLFNSHSKVLWHLRGHVKSLMSVLPELEEIYSVFLDMIYHQVIQVTISFYLHSSFFINLFLWGFGHFGYGLWCAIENLDLIRWRWLTDRHIWYQNIPLRLLFWQDLLLPPLFFSFELLFNNWALFSVLYSSSSEYLYLGRSKHLKLSFFFDLDLF